MSGQPLLDAHQIGLGETGNETWARNVVQALEADGGPPLDYAVTSVALPLLDLPPDRTVLVAGSSTRRLALDLPREIRRRRSSVVVAQYTLPLTRVPGVTVVHDVSFMLPQARNWIPAASLARYRLTIGTSIRRARVVVVPTEYTRGQVLARFGVDERHVLVAPLALDAHLKFHRINPRIDRHHAVILCVGAVLPRKNLTIVARAVGRLRAQGTDVRLRLVGPVREAGREDVALMRNVLGASLEVVGAVTSGGLAQEYAGADVLAYPSLHEGFGLPLLEGMAAGLPVVCSSATCLPEVAGNAAQLVDPADVEGWATALASALKEPGSWSARGRARVAEFSWATTASVVREAMDFAVG